MKKNNILIVDDDNYTIELYNMLISWSPYKKYVITQEHAIQAINYLSDLNTNNPAAFPDYILLDLRMPEMHGFDFIRLFEEKFPDRKSKTSFIITTSSVIKKDKEEAFRFECVKDFIVKPIPGNYIEKLVTGVLTEILE